MTLVYGLCLTVFVLVVLLMLIVRILFYSYKENKKLNEKIKRQEKIVGYLFEHAKHLEGIKKYNNELLRRIQNAQNDDDINSVIADIVNRNNSRVQNSTNAENGASAEAEQGKTRSAKKP